MKLLLVGGYFNMTLGLLACFIITAFLVHIFLYWKFRSTDINRPVGTQKLNSYLPEYDFMERHSIVIPSSPEKVFRAIHNFDMGKSKIIKLLVFLRSIPHRLNSSSVKQEPIKLTLDQLTKKGDWILLEEAANREIVIGFAGKFWQPKADMIDFSTTADFLSFNQAGYSKAAWNLLITRNDDGTVTLSTETRILCLGEGATSFFRFYWAVIRPYSGWIRLEMLKIIKEAAEK